MRIAGTRLHPTATHTTKQFRAAADEGTDLISIPVEVTDRHLIQLLARKLKLFIGLLNDRRVAPFGIGCTDLRSFCRTYLKIPRELCRPLVVRAPGAASVVGSFPMSDPQHRAGATSARPFGLARFGWYTLRSPVG